MYGAKIKTKLNNIQKEHVYVGLTSTPFITRYRNHTHSFRKKELRNATELSKFIWECIENGTEYKIEWKIIRSAPSYKPGSKYCNLCISEALHIA